MPHDPEDKVVMDVAFFIRLLEMAREDINDDALLHKVADKIISKSRDGYVVTMKDYAELQDMVKGKKVPDIERLRSLAGL